MLAAARRAVKEGTLAREVVVRVLSHQAYPLVALHLQSSNLIRILVFSSLSLSEQLQL